MDLEAIGFFLLGSQKCFSSRRQQFEAVNSWRKWNTLLKGIIRAPTSVTCSIPSTQAGSEGKTNMGRSAFLLFSLIYLKHSSPSIFFFNCSLVCVFQKRSGGVCSFLHRACWAALPLQLLLLLLLLLAFLLPLAEETHSCTLANNFAWSFNLMLRYESPPPT